MLLSAAESVGNMGIPAGVQCFHKWQQRVPLAFLPNVIETRT
jgi:hypothetical protein